MTATTTQPTAVPLPNLGRCHGCPDEIRIRRNGRLHSHGCTGDGSLPLLVLKPTFARWLWMQAKRRDDYTNPLTCFAGRIWRPCTCSPKQNAGDVDWSTPEQLHDWLHRRQIELGGRNECDWLCRDLDEAANTYAHLATA